VGVAGNWFGRFILLGAREHKGFAVFSDVVISSVVDTPRRSDWAWDPVVWLAHGLRLELDGEVVVVHRRVLWVVLGVFLEAVQLGQLFISPYDFH
jgi:hypothetical protein